MGPERRGRAVHGRLEVNPSGEETDGWTEAEVEVV